MHFQAWGNWCNRSDDEHSWEDSDDESSNDDIKDGKNKSRQKGILPSNYWGAITHGNNNQQ